MALVREERHLPQPPTELPPHVHFSPPLFILHKMLTEISDMCNAYSSSPVHQALHPMREALWLPFAYNSSLGPTTVLPA